MYKRQSYESAEVDDVLFTPDVLPVPEDADLDGEPNNDSITVGKSVMTYTDDQYAEMGLDSQTTIDVGDYIAFYSGDFEEESGNGESSSEVTGYGPVSYTHLQRIQRSGGSTRSIRTGYSISSGYAGPEKPLAAAARKTWGRRVRSG